MSGDEAELPLEDDGHLQAVQRIAGLGNRYFVSANSQEGGSLLVHEASGGENGGPIEGAALSHVGRFDIGAAHPGGIQAVGSILAIAVQGENGEQGCIDFRLFESPDSPPQRIGRLVLDGSRNEPQQPIVYVTSVALTRLDAEAGEDYLMFVNDKDDKDRGWFYRGSPYDDNSWQYLDYFEAASDLAANDVWGKYQNTNFVTECGTGDVYMVGMGNPEFSPLNTGLHLFAESCADLLNFFTAGPESVVCASSQILSLFGVTDGGCPDLSVGLGPVGDDLFHLYRVTPSSNGDVAVEQVERKTIKPMHSFGTCNLRAASGVYVTPRHEMILYCGPHSYFPPATMLEERVQFDPGVCLDAEGNFDFAAAPRCMTYLYNSQIPAEAPY